MNTPQMRKKPKNIEKGDSALFGIPEGKVRNAILEYENGNPKILGDIMNKIQEVVDNMTSQKIEEAKLPYLGSTLKSLVQAYHFINLTLGGFDFDKSFKGVDIPEDPEEIIEKSAEISLKVKRKWDKGK